ncbi:MAG: ribokinase [Clostridiales bacterium]|nr:ribokinase [Clostridiales bacterium]
MKKIAVIGSMNIDLVSRVPAFLKPGESIRGLDYQVFHGGKGGNQAIAAARLGANVMMLAKVGPDAGGAAYTASMQDAGINVSCVEQTDSTNTGTAIIEVDAGSGDNRIVYHPGANLLVDTEQIDSHWQQLMAYDIFLLQLEIPLDTVQYAMEKLTAAGKTVILDPAPAAPLNRAMLSSPSYLTPNETELAILTGMPSDTPENIGQAGRALLKLGAKAVIVKAGKQGAFYIDDAGVRHAQGFRVDPVDTTAAGDSFNAGFAAALSHSMPLDEALRYANAVGALSTLGAGAQSAMPTVQAVAQFIAERSTAEK